MSDVYSFCQFKNFIDSITLDLYFNLLEDFKEEYYSMEFRKKDSSLPSVDEYGQFRYDIPIIESEQVWKLKISGFEFEDFFKRYNFLENSLIEEMDLILNTQFTIDDSGSFRDDIINWLKERISGISFNSNRSIFECDFIHYGENYCKISFHGKFNYEIQEFIKELKWKLMRTYGNLAEKNPIYPMKINIKWNKEKVDLLELMAALVESESLTINNEPITKELMVDILSKIITNVDLTNFHKDLSQAKKRKKEKAPYLKYLVKTFEDYSTKSSTNPSISS